MSKSIVIMFEVGKLHGECAPGRFRLVIGSTSVEVQTEESDELGLLTKRWQKTGSTPVAIPRVLSLAVQYLVDTDDVIALGDGTQVIALGNIKPDAR